MPRPATTFVCSACATESAKWHGQCPGCGAWNTLAEEARPPAAAAPRGRAAKPVRLADVRAERHARLSTGIGELDRILGGGVVPGSLVLIGGSPGGPKPA
jgi:DNA repair protein RadA/Sms